MSKYLNIAIAIIALIVLATTYFLGKSAGYDDGYIIGKDEIQLQLNDLTKKYNDLVKTSNAKITLLEQQAYQASQEKDQAIKDFQAQLEKLLVQDQSRAWSKETVRLINEAIK